MRYSRFWIKKYHRKPRQNYRSYAFKMAYHHRKSTCSNIQALKMTSVDPVTRWKKSIWFNKVTKVTIDAGGFSLMICRFECVTSLKICPGSLLLRIGERFRGYFCTQTPLGSWTIFLTMTIYECHNDSSSCYHGPLLALVRMPYEYRRSYDTRTNASTCE